MYRLTYDMCTRPEGPPLSTSHTLRPRPQKKLAGHASLRKVDVNILWQWLFVAVKYILSVFVVELCLVNS